jgi:hypothetical protein
MFLLTPMRSCYNISPWMLSVVFFVVDAYDCYVVDVWVFEEFAFEFGGSD